MTAMAAIPCHIVIEGNPAIIYASRNGNPEKVLPILTRFLEKFWQERDALGETAETPACLTAQITVRFGFEICEDDFSNLRVGVNFSPDVQYLYQITSDRRLYVFVPDAPYRENPSCGLQGCRKIALEAMTSMSL